MKWYKIQNRSQKNSHSFVPLMYFVQHIFQHTAFQTEEGYHGTGQVEFEAKAGQGKQSAKFVGFNPQFLRFASPLIENPQFS
jgi:hypothetical protein